MNEARIQRIFKRTAFGIKPGLAVTEALFAEMGNPHKKLRVIHVAGTNGKGSVSTMVTAMLQAHGVKVGLYTSPHLVRLNERFKIDGVDIDDASLDALLEEIEDAAIRVEQAGKGVPTFFECTTVLGMVWFLRMGVQIAVAEVGMGGRLDSTNVLSPLVSVITKIGLDHTEYLGNTLAAVAGEKAGIIKSGVPVVCARQADEAWGVLTARASEMNAQLVPSWEAVSVQRISGDLCGQKVKIASERESYGTVNMKLAASYQLENIALAVATMETLGDVLGIEFEAKKIAKGLSDAYWPGRFHCIDPATPLLVDGAHNPDGVRALVHALADAKYKKNVLFVVGMCADKDCSAFFKTIATICGRVWTVPINNPRSASPEALAELAHCHGIDATPCATVEDGIAQAKASARVEGTPIVVCGSLFLVGDCVAHKK